MTQRIHTLELMNEYLRIFEDDLKSTLNLQSAIKGHIEWLPGQTINGMANGVFITVEPNINIERVQLPSDMLITYNFRVLYVKRINVNENVETQKLNDVNTIIEKLIDKFTLPDLTLTNGQVLWSLPVTVEMMPPEDDFVQALAADLVAAAFRVECLVRTRR